ncbi:protein kinase domain-containing protein [Paraliomyxa miuraensis]|uniref:serine/threonine-protein kinase n=1 Tax=Paraliomyxa miuraensis TaxID=376150 RepID=UPI002257FBD9|nr:serine/threonine-protein kinase [Paraliomyxa miuraensis]MCX4242549.1 serine/threonine-protein kinase [Paraliomyxa miuraensis]
MDPKGKPSEDTKRRRPTLPPPPMVGLPPIKKPSEPAGTRSSELKTGSEASGLIRVAEARPVNVDGADPDPTPDAIPVPASETAEPDPTTAETAEEPIPELPKPAPPKPVPRPGPRLTLPKLGAKGPSAPHDPSSRSLKKTGQSKPPKDTTLTRVRLTDTSALHDPESIEADSTGVQVIEQVRLEPGELVVGTRYRIVGWLGEGGMGVVYECEHLDIERRVALKILRSGVDPNSRRARMFREEARAVSRAGRSEDGQVSNIVEVYDFGELPDGRMWFAMELLHGRSLARLLAEGPMDPARLIAVLRQLCKGLAAVHDANVIHRDIKPGNVMVVRDRGRDDVVKVVDFGVAAVLAEGDSGEVQLEGTPNYMAPEQATGSRFDHRLDIYAVGAVGFHMLAGAPPFHGDDVFQLLRRVCTEPPPRPSELNPEGGIPSALEDVILRCLAKDPDDRYADMRDLEAALCEAQISSKLTTAWDDLPIPTVEPQSRYDAIVKGMPRPASGLHRPGRNRMLVAAAAVVLALGGVGVVIARQNDASAEVAERIAEHVAAARGAAARAFYLYPPSDEPETRTAYVEVLELEGLEPELGKPAVEAATELRKEFAGTLVRLGDRYWDSKGGRPFAVDYYIAALAFDPTDATARERAPITPGELTELRRKAASLDFEAMELSASEPLLALAEDDDEERVRKLERLGSKDDERGLQAELRIQKLLEEEGVETQVAAAEPKPRKSDRKSAPRPTEPEPDLELGDDVDGDDGGGRVAPRESQRSNELVTQGLAALRSGQRKNAETLFHRALDQDHKSHRALDGLAQVHHAEGDYDKAVQYGKRAVGMAPGRGSYRIHLGDAYFKVFRYREAKEQYRKADELGHGEARARLEKVDSKLGN